MIHCVMPFSIKDDDIKDLADEVQRMMGWPSRTDTIRQALKAQKEAATQSTPLQSRILTLQRRARKLREDRRD